MAKGKTKSEAARKRDRQQIGVAHKLAEEAAKLFPALTAGAFEPAKLVAQAQYVLDVAKLKTERHREGEISGAHVEQILRSVRHFANGLAHVGVKVLGLPYVKQSHYLSVMRHWQDDPPSEARNVGRTLSHLRRLFAAIGRPDVIPRGTRNMDLLASQGITFGTGAAFLVNTYFDWLSEGIDPQLIFDAIPDLGKRLAAKMMFYWGMSLSEVASWQPLDPRSCDFLRIDAFDGRRSSRDAEFSLDDDYSLRQMTVLQEAWSYCQQRGLPGLRSEHDSAEHYADHLRGSIRHVLGKLFPNIGLKPMQLRDGFFSQVFRDHAGMSMSEARSRPQFTREDRRLARAWNEAKLQMGVKGAKAAGANAGLPRSGAKSAYVARHLRSLSRPLAAAHVEVVWAGNTGTGPCLFVKFQDCVREDSARVRVQEVMEQKFPVRLRVVTVWDRSHVPAHAVPVLLRRSPAVAWPL